MNKRKNSAEPIFYGKTRLILFVYVKECEKENYLPFIGIMSFADVNVAYVKYTLSCFVETIIFT